MFSILGGSLLRQLQLMHQKHDEDADQERNEGRVKGDAQTLGDPGNVPLGRLVRLAKGLSDPANGS